MKIFLAVILLILLSLAAKSHNVKIAGIGELPLIYKSILVQLILNLSIIFALILGAIFIFYDWKYLLGALIVFIFFNKIVVRILEPILFLPLYKIENRIRR